MPRRALANYLSLTVSPRGEGASRGKGPAGPRRIPAHSARGGSRRPGTGSGACPCPGAHCLSSRRPRLLFIFVALILFLFSFFIFIICLLLPPSIPSIPGWRFPG